MWFLYVLTFAAFVASFFADRKKSVLAIKAAFNMFIEMLPAFIVMIIFVSSAVYFTSGFAIADLFSGKNKILSVLIASFIGSITLMPGFIAFPLCGILLEQGVPYMVLSAFTTTLMMVGILTFPLEKMYFGTKVTILRNIAGFIIAIIIAVVTGIFFGEVF